MKAKEIDGNLLKLIVTNGSIKLKNQHQQINDLNVFPVPDGDTGSNMQSTMMSGVNAIQNLDNQPIEAVGKALSRGLLMGARGNSGVILSQLFSGFAKAFQSRHTADAPAFIEGLRQGVEQAYSAVINPVEGTILTVAREAADKASLMATPDSDIEDVLEVYLDEAKKSLDRTPDLLPVLKESGVVDSGGAGLIVIIEGMISALRGEVYSEDTQASSAIARAHDVQGEVEFGYCTEFIIQLDPEKKFSKDRFVKQLSRLGDSIAVVADDELCKVHIHTLTPGDALNLGQQYGEFATLKIENMTVQHSEIMEQAQAHQHAPQAEPEKKAPPSPPKKYGIITVLTGSGLHQLFKEMGVDFIIDGGQTMNPSTQDFIDAVESVNADNILIVPNNKNVFLSAQTAAKTFEDKNVIVIPAKTVAQGYASLTMFDASQELDDIVAEMQELIDHVQSGEITHAVRDTEIKGLQIKKGDFLSIANGQIIAAEPKRLDAMIQLLKSIVRRDAEIITVMTGETADKKEVAKIRKHIEESYSHVEVEIVDGGQAVYDYLIAVE